MSWPVLVLAPRIPVTRPRWRTNQRVATVGPEDAGDEPGAEPGQQAEDERQLPDLADERSTRASEPAVTSRLTSDDVADTDPAHEPAAQRPRQAEHDEADRGRERHGRGRPAGLLRHRQEERAGRGADAGRHEHDDRRDGDDDPAVEQDPPHSRDASARRAGAAAASSSFERPPRSRQVDQGLRRHRPSSVPMPSQNHGTGS